MIKAIPGYEGLYAIDDSGNVLSYKCGRTKVLKPSIDTAGYYKVGLHKDKVQKTFRIHSLVAKIFLPDFEEGLDIDHIDRNRLNNTISNLRMVTRQENMFNTNAKGYYFNKKANKFQAYINIGKEQIYLGLFDTEEKARQAYLDAKEKLHIIST